jgi:IS1 family transposase
VKAARVQCDEIWSFCYAKKKNVKTAKSALEDSDDVWTWTAIEAQSKLIISYTFSGARDAECALTFMDDLRSRLANRVQITTDGLRSYLIE